VDAEPTLTIGGCTLDHNEEIAAFLSEALFTSIKEKVAWKRNAFIFKWGKELSEGFGTNTI